LLNLLKVLDKLLRQQRFIQAASIFGFSKLALSRLKNYLAIHCMSGQAANVSRHRNSFRHNIEQLVPTPPSLVCQYPVYLSIQNHFFVVFQYIM
jgi:hypothetical protein